MAQEKAGSSGLRPIGMTSPFLWERNVDARSVGSGQWAVLCGLLLVFAVCGPVGAQENGKSPGAGIFKTKCVLCHGADGAGKTALGKQLQAADLHSKDVQKRSNAELQKIVHDGQGNMPSFAEQLSDDEIDQVIQYVREFGKPAKTAKKQ